MYCSWLHVWRFSFRPPGPDSQQWPRINTSAEGPQQHLVPPGGSMYEMPRVLNTNRSKIILERLLAWGLTHAYKTYIYQHYVAHVRLKVRLLASPLLSPRWQSNSMMGHNLAGWLTTCVNAGSATGGQLLIAASERAHSRSDAYTHFCTDLDAALDRISWRC